MKSNVFADTVESIQQEYAEAVNKYNSAVAEYSKQKKNYSAEVRRVENDVRRAVEDKIFTSCSAQFMHDTDIEVNIGSYSREDKSYDMLEVRIKHEGENGFANNSNVALKWEWDVAVHTNSVEQSTNSYSGLNAVTKETLHELQESIDVMEKLAAIPDKDWINLRSKANKAVPDDAFLANEPCRVSYDPYFWRIMESIAGKDLYINTELQYITFDEGKQVHVPLYIQVLSVAGKSVRFNLVRSDGDRILTVSANKRQPKDVFKSNVAVPVSVHDAYDITE